MKTSINNRLDPYTTTRSAPTADIGSGCWRHPDWIVVDCLGCRFIVARARMCDRRRRDTVTAYYRDLQEQYDHGLDR